MLAALLLTAACAPATTTSAPTSSTTTNQAQTTIVATTPSTTPLTTRVETTHPTNGIEFDPQTITGEVTNPLFPLVVGSRWVYQESGGPEHVEVEVLAETKNILGIDATVVRDTVTEDGEIIEDTYDWYGQDAEGNVWYLGEDTKEYEGGQVVSTEGSWEAGVDGAEPGIIMEAVPQVGDTYRQEYYEGKAEDEAEVVRLGDSATVPYDSFSELVVTKEWTLLEPDVAEEKYYAGGVGVVLEVVIEGGSGRLELIEFQPGG